MLLATTDLLIEDVHFRRRWATPEDIGWKSLAVNVSDVAAMGGRPRWALIALACPEGVGIDEGEAFYAGVQTLAGEHDVVVVGGTLPHRQEAGSSTSRCSATRPESRS